MSSLRVCVRLVLITTLLLTVAFASPTPFATERTGITSVETNGLDPSSEFLDNHDTKMIEQVNADAVSLAEPLLRKHDGDSGLFQPRIQSREDCKRQCSEKDLKRKCKELQQHKKSMKAVTEIGFDNGCEVSGETDKDYHSKGGSNVDTNACC